MDETDGRTGEQICNAIAVQMAEEKKRVKENFSKANLLNTAIRDLTARLAAIESEILRLSQSPPQRVTVGKGHARELSVAIGDSMLRMRKMAELQAEKAVFARNLDVARSEYQNAQRTFDQARENLSRLELEFVEHDCGPVTSPALTFPPF